MSEKTFSQDDEDELRAALIGRSVVAVKMFGDDAPKLDRYETAQGEVQLDDGSRLLLAGNVGGCSCGAGDYDLTRLNAMPMNGITNVEVVVDEAAGDSYEPDKTYRVFVLAFDGARHELATFEGNDGNGYYGTGFWFRIVRREAGRS